MWKKACGDEIWSEIVAGARRILTLRARSDNLLTPLTKNRVSIGASRWSRTFSNKFSKEGWQLAPASLLYGFVLGIEKKLPALGQSVFQAGPTSRTVNRLV